MQLGVEAAGAGPDGDGRHPAQRPGRPRRGPHDRARNGHQRVATGERAVEVEGGDAATGHGLVTLGGAADRTNMRQDATAPTRAPRSRSACANGKPAAARASARPAARREQQRVDQGTDARAAAADEPRDRQERRTVERLAERLGERGVGDRARRGEVRRHRTAGRRRWRDGSPGPRRSSVIHDIHWRPRPGLAAQPELEDRQLLAQRAAVEASSTIPVRMWTTRMPAPAAVAVARLPGQADLGEEVVAGRRLLGEDLVAPVAVVPDRRAADERPGGRPARPGPSPGAWCPAGGSPGPARCASAVHGGPSDALAGEVDDGIEALERRGIDGAGGRVPVDPVDPSQPGRTSGITR